MSSSAGFLTKRSAPRAICHRLGLLVLAGALTLGAGASQASSESAGDVVTITALLNNTGQPAMDVMIGNFERVYPNIKVDATYAQVTALTQLELTELAAGNAPDLLHVSVGCQPGTSVCVLAKAGYLAPLVNEPWAKRSRSLPLVTSASKYGQALYAFDPGVAPEGLFKNDDLFKKLKLTVPQTFPQLLHLCQAAQSGRHRGDRARRRQPADDVVPDRSPRGSDRLREGSALGH